MGGGPLEPWLTLIVLLVGGPWMQDVENETRDKQSVGNKDVHCSMIAHCASLLMSTDFQHLRRSTRAP